RTFVVGQSGRGRSSPAKLARPPLHSVPSGMTCRSRPSTPGTRMLSQSATSAPAATAARQAAGFIWAAVPAPDITDGLGGDDRAPGAWAGAPNAIAPVSAPPSAMRASLRCTAGGTGGGAPKVQITRDLHKRFWEPKLDALATELARQARAPVEALTG